MSYSITVPTGLQLPTNFTECPLAAPGSLAFELSGNYQYCPQVQEINLRPFIDGNIVMPNAVQLVTDAIQAIATDPYCASMLGFIFNHSPGFKFFLTTSKTDPFQAKSTINSKTPITAKSNAGFVRKKNLLLIFTDIITEKEFISILRHELQHVYQSLTASPYLEDITQIYPDHYLNLFSLTPSGCAEAQDAIKNDFRNLKNNPTKYLKKFNGIIVKIKDNLPKQGYFQLKAATVSACQLFEKKKHELRVGLKKNSDDYKGVVEIIDLLADGLLLKFPYTLQSAIFLSDMMIKQMVINFFPSEERYRNLGEIDAHLHQILPHSIIELMFPTFSSKLSIAILSANKNRVFHDGFSDMLVSGINHETVLSYPYSFTNSQLLYVIGKIFIEPKNYNQHDINNAIKTLKERTDTNQFRAEEKKMANLYLARLYYYRTGLDKNLISFFNHDTESLSLACKSYKVVFHNLDKVHLPIVVSDALQYISCIKEMSRKTRNKGPLSDALSLAERVAKALIARKILAIPSEENYLAGAISDFHKECALLKSLMKS